MVYMCATHRRFEHSLGVMHLAGQWLFWIHTRQPKLIITPKDKVCVMIAGLLHDLGHGPFSHTYEFFLEEHEEAMKKGSLLGQTFDERMYEDFPDKPNGWAHEDATLMMIDDLLKSLGLEIDESNLDGPLKQIGDGYDAAQFGLWDKENANKPLPIESLMTNRDFIFIKECIIGGPLPPKGMSIREFKRSSLPKTLIGRTDPRKEFLYDIVCNRHSGFDVDKIDYLARDTLRSHGNDCVADTSNRLIQDKAFVARAECSDPSKCWKCLQNPHGPSIHLMMYVFLIVASLCYYCLCPLNGVILHSLQMLPNERCIKRYEHLPAKIHRARSSIQTLQNNMPKLHAKRYLYPRGALFSIKCYKIQQRWFLRDNESSH